MFYSLVHMQPGFGDLRTFRLYRGILFQMMQTRIYHYLLIIFQTGISQMNKELLLSSSFGESGKHETSLFLKNFRECPLRLISQTEEVKEWINILRTQQPHQGSSMSRSSSINIKHWTKPQSLYVKSNFDASFHNNSTQCFMGWIIRDNEGTPKVWGSSALGHVNTPLGAETKALLVAMQQAWIRGYTRVHFEGDCEILINTINGKTSRWDIANLLVDIDFWASKFSAVFSFSQLGNVIV